ncbi:MAG: hypothetical protein Q4C00_00745 [Bacillota bacterium]|nr:hypothetical protein [Bacillota bacterium]
MGQIGYGGIAVNILDVLFRERLAVEACFLKIPKQAWDESPILGYHLPEKPGFSGKW